MRGPLMSRREVLRRSALLGMAGFVGSRLDLLGGGPAAALAAETSTKTAATYYTPEKVAAARRNVERYDWARAIRDGRVKDAAPWLAKDDEWLWRSVTGQGLPRSYAVNEPLGSPITGTDIYRYGRQPWRADPFGRPWKLEDPTSGYVFPTNDFAAFYASALDEHGNFRRELGDRSLLVNELYPERGRDWGVDDGFGWVDSNGDKWTFVAYYNFFITWFAVTTAPSLVWAGLVYLRDAFILTGDMRYAHAGLIMLDRVADVFPDMDTGAYRREDGYLTSDGLSGRGKVVGRIWDCDLVREIVAVYDGLFPAIADGDEANVVPFLSAQAERYGLPPKDSPAAIRANIESRLIREVYPAVRGAQIGGNFGMHQSTLAMAAVVQDDPVDSKEWIDFIFATGAIESEPEWHISGGDVYRTLVDKLDRDGFSDEGSAQYNTLWITQFRGMADILSSYERYPAADLFEHPKVRKLFGSRHQLAMLNAYTPGIGDTGRTGKPDLFAGPADYVHDFEVYGLPAYAQMAYLLAHGDADSLHGDVFAADPTATPRRIRQVIDQQGPLHLPSDDLTGFGFAALRAGDGDAMRGAWIYYGRNHGHGHADALNLGLLGFGVDLAPDLGYPETADRSARSNEWTHNTIAHNTVVVDAAPQKPQWVGRPHGFAVTGRVRMADVAAPEVYPQTSSYRRVTAMVDLDDASSYVVDVFRVAGGREHHFSFHGAEGPVTVEGLSLTRQPTGTYAGPDVEPPPDDAEARPGANGFDWLFNVERDDSPGAEFSVDWAIRDTWDVLPGDPDLHLRMTMLTQVDDVALADGIPARNQPGNPKSLRYVIARRAGGAGLASQFVSVLEPYVGRRPLRSVRLAPVRVLEGRAAAHEVAAVRVELADGRVDYVISSAAPDARLLVDGRVMFRGSFGVYSEKGGRPVYGCHHDATMLGPLPHMEAPAGALTGRVADFTRDLSVENRLVLDVGRQRFDPAQLVGGFVYVDNDGVRNAVYRIHDAQPDGLTRVVLDIGDATLIRGYVDPEHFSRGYVYDVAPGAAARIPLTREWTP